jgi:hypothetical protein
LLRCEAAPSINTHKAHQHMSMYTFQTKQKEEEGGGEEEEEEQRLWQ